MATHGGVFSPLQAHGPRQRPLEAVPKANAVQHRIQEIRYGAIMAVLRIGMVSRVMTRCLQDANILEKRNHRTVLGASAVRPLVDFVGVRADDRKQPDFPVQYAQKPCRDDEQRRHATQVSRTLPPAILRHVSRIMVMSDIRPRERPADDRRILPDIGVFNPMNEPADKFGRKHGPDDS